MEIYIHRPVRYRSIRKRWLTETGQAVLTMFGVVGWGLCWYIAPLLSRWWG